MNKFQQVQKATYDRIETATRLGISRATLDRRLDEFPHVRIGRRVLFTEENIQQILQKQLRQPKK